MSIWIYEDTYPTPTEPEVTRDVCLFCESRMEYISVSSERILHAEIRVCCYCGWWCRNERHRNPDYDGFEESEILHHYYSMEGACAQLKNLDLSDIRLPLDEVRKYLIAKYQDRFNIHPRKFEEVVASVFRDQGYCAVVTAYQNDGGIDVILKNSTETIGVQVKRYKNKIEAEQIRALAGALMEGTYTSGVFVTTSSFRSGGYDSVEKLGARGLPIKLIDAERFYDELKIVAKTELNYENLEEFVFDLQLIGESHIIYENEGPY